MENKILGEENGEQVLGEENGGEQVVGEENGGKQF